jgi:predicted nucleotidyltransferase
LKSLNDHAVEYVIIGDAALPVYGPFSTGLAVGLFIRPSQDNAAAALEALADFGYDVSDVTVGDLRTKKLFVRQHMVETDIHPSVKGVTFEEVWANKVEGEYQETPAFFASLDDLIRMKEAAGRPKDLEDLVTLREIKRRREQEGN